jgi:hypothetical protein
METMRFAETSMNFHQATQLHISEYSTSLDISEAHWNELFVHLYFFPLHSLCSNEWLWISDCQGSGPPTMFRGTNPSFSRAAEENSGDAIRTNDISEAYRTWSMANHYSSMSHNITAKALMEGWNSRWKQTSVMLRKVVTNICEYGDELLSSVTVPYVSVGCIIIIQYTNLNYNFASVLYDYEALYLIVTCIPVARQRLGKHIPEQSKRSQQ